MKYYILLLLLFTKLLFADTIGNYITIANNIPSMELKPDEHAQAWVRSARTILAATDETIIETLVIMNATAAKQGKPIFCLPPNQTITISTDQADEIIKKTYNDLAQKGIDIKNMSVSEVAMLGFIKVYPCKA